MRKKDFYKSYEQLSVEARNTLSGQWRSNAKICLLYVFLQLICLAGAVVPFFFLKWYWITLCIIASVWLFMVFKYGYNAYCLYFESKYEKKVSLIFSGFGRNFFKIFAIFIVKTLYCVFALVLFIYPGVYLYTGYEITDFVLFENPQKKVGEVLKSSLKLMKDNKKKLFVLWMNNIHWFTLGILTAGIGLLWFIPYFKLVKANIYLDLKTDF